jgi:uncharacterized protein YjbJ (UPF0337 family)
LQSPPPSQASRATSGESDEINGCIQKRTGETREAVEKTVNEFFADRR